MLKVIPSSPFTKKNYVPTVFDVDLHASLYVEIPLAGYTTTTVKMKSVEIMAKIAKTSGTFSCLMTVKLSIVSTIITMSKIIAMNIAATQYFSKSYLF
jgi:hypothetical protein